MSGSFWLGFGVVGVVGVFSVFVCGDSRSGGEWIDDDGDGGGGGGGSRGV